MSQSVSCSRWDKIEKSDGKTLLSQAKSEATKAPNYQIGDRMSPVPSDFSILSLRKHGTLQASAITGRHPAPRRIPPPKEAGALLTF